MNTTLKRGWRQLPQALALETVRLGSAGLSASYYAALGLVAHPLAAAGLGVLAFALDYSKAHVMRASASAPTLPRRIAAGGIFLALFLASMIAVDGSLMKLRSDWTGSRADTIGEWDRTQADYQAAAAELDRLAGVRSIADVKAALDAAPVSRKVFARTSECTDVTRTDSFEACKPILDLRQEMAQAIRKRELEGKREAAKARLDAMPRPAAADPQADVIAKAMQPWGLSEELVAYLLVAIVGLAVELVACFGLWVLSEPPRPVAANDTDPAASPGPRPPHARPRLAAGSPQGSRQAQPRKDPQIVAFVTEFRRRHGRNPTYPEMRSRFQGIAKTTAWRYQVAA